MVQIACAAERVRPRARPVVSTLALAGVMAAALLGGSAAGAPGVRAEPRSLSGDIGVSGSPPSAAWPSSLVIADAGDDGGGNIIIDCSHSSGLLSSPAPGATKTRVNEHQTTVDAFVCATGAIVAETASPFRVWLRGPSAATAATRAQRRPPAMSPPMWDVPFQPGQPAFRAIVQVRAGGWATAQGVVAQFENVTVSLASLRNASATAAFGRPSADILAWHEAGAAARRAQAAVELLFPDASSCNATVDVYSSTMADGTSNGGNVIVPGEGGPANASSCPIGANSGLAFAVPLPVLRAGWTGNLTAVTGLRAVPGSPVVSLAMSPVVVSVAAPAAQRPAAPALAFASSVRWNLTDPRPAPSDASTVVFADVPFGFRTPGRDSSAALTPPAANAAVPATSSVVMASVPVTVPRATGGIGPACVALDIALDGRLYDACRRPGLDRAAGCAAMPSAAGTRGDGLAVDGGSAVSSLWESTVSSVNTAPARLADLLHVPGRPQGREVSCLWLRLPAQNVSSARVAPVAFAGTPLATASVSESASRFLKLNQPPEHPAPAGAVDPTTGSISQDLPGVRWTWLGLACSSTAAWSAGRRTTVSGTTNSTGAPWAFTHRSGGDPSLGTHPWAAAGVIAVDEAAGGGLLGPGVAPGASLPALGGWSGPIPSAGGPVARWLRADPVDALPSSRAGQGVGDSAAAAAERWVASAGTLPAGRTRAERIVTMAEAPPAPDSQGSDVVRIPLLLSPASVYRVRARVVTLDLRAGEEPPQGWCDCHSHASRPAEQPPGNGTCVGPPPPIGSPGAGPRCSAVGGAWRDASPGGPVLRAVRSLVSDTSAVGMLVTPPVAPGAPAAATVTSINSSALQVLASPPLDTGGCGVSLLEVKRERQVLPPGALGGGAFFDGARPESWEGYAMARRVIAWEDDPTWRDTWILASVLNDTDASAATPFPLPPGMAAGTSPFLDDLGDPLTLILRSSSGWPLTHWDGSLQRFTHFRHYARAQTAAGWGPASPPHRSQTAASPATPPRDIAFVPQWHTAVQLGIRFRPPLDSGGPPILSFFRALTANGTYATTYPPFSTNLATPAQAASWSADPMAPEVWFVSNLTGLSWATTYDVRIMAASSIQGQFSSSITATTDSPRACSPGCVSALGSCHEWNGRCDCRPGWTGADCSVASGEVVILRLDAAAGSLALTGAAIAQLGGATPPPASGHTDVPLATSAPAAAALVAQGTTRAEKQALINRLFGPGFDVTLSGNAIAPILRQVAKAAGADSTAFPRLKILSARLTNAQTLLGSPAQPGRGILTVVVSFGGVAALTAAQRGALSNLSSAPAPALLAGFRAAAVAQQSVVRGMAARQAAFPAAMGQAGDGTVVDLDPPGCSVVGASDKGCVACTADDACAFCPTRDACAPGTYAGFAVGSAPCPLLAEPLGSSGTGSLDVEPLSLAQFIHARAPSDLPASSPVCLPPCDQVSGCDSCTVRADCRFCRTTQRCSTVHTLGLIDTPRIGNGLCPFSSIADDLRICPSRRCAVRSGTTRSYCLDDRMCGWCTGGLAPAPGSSAPPSGSSAGACVEGDSFGPIGASCPSSWFFRRAVSCIDVGLAGIAAQDDDQPELETSQASAVCQSCTGQTLGCGYCNSTRSCVSASDDGVGPALGTCGSGWVAPGRSGATCPTKPLTRREQCELKQSCGGCQSLDFCSWCDLGKDARGRCLLDADKAVHKAVGVPGGVDAVNLQCTSITPFAQLLRSTCLDGCASSTRVVQLSGSVAAGSIGTRRSGVAPLAPAPTLRARGLHRGSSSSGGDGGGTGGASHSRRLQVANGSSVPASIDISYHTTQECEWVVDPRPLTSSLRSVTPAAVPQSSSGGSDGSSPASASSAQSSAQQYEPSTLPTVHVVLEAVDLGFGDQLVVYDGPSPLTARAMVTISGSSVVGAFQRQNDMVAKWHDGYVPTDPATTEGVPAGGLFVVTASSGVVSVALVGRDIVRGDQASSRALDASSLGRRGAGEGGLPLGFQLSFTSTENRPIDVYFVVGVAVVALGVLCIGVIAAGRMRRRIVRRRQMAGGFDVEVDDESFAQAAQRARVEGTATPASVLRSLPSFVFRRDLVEQTPLAGVADEDLCCPITLEDFADGVTLLRVLPCKHVFSSEGVDNWLRLNKGCPLCKADVVDGHVQRMSAIEAGLVDPLGLGPDVELRDGFRLSPDAQAGAAGPPRRRAHSSGNPRLASPRIGAREDSMDADDGSEEGDPQGMESSSVASSEDQAPGAVPNPRPFFGSDSPPGPRPSRGQAGGPIALPPPPPPPAGGSSQPTHPSPSAAGRAGPTRRMFPSLQLSASHGVARPSLQSDSPAGNPRQAPAAVVTSGGRFGVSNPLARPRSASRSSTTAGLMGMSNPLAASSAYSRPAGGGRG